MATKGTKNKRIEQTEANAVLESVKGLDLNKVVAEVSGLQVNVQNTLANLSSSLTNKVQQLSQMDTAIELKEQRLQELYGIENMAITLDEMKAQRELEEQQANAQRIERNKQAADEELERQKKYKREQDDYDYQCAVARKKWKDDFDAEVANAKRNEEARKEMLARAWHEREMALKSQEQHLADLQKQVSEFDSRLKTEVAKAEKIIENTVKRDYEHKIALLTKDAESDKHSNLIKNSAYEMTIKGLEEQIKDFKTQLISARNDAKDVATQALQSASGRQVADALQKVVDSKEMSAKAK